MQASNSKQNKALNLRLVLSHIATLTPVSRAEIAKITGLTKQTITNMVDELLAAGLISELGVKRQGTVGKPSKMLALSGKNTVNAGIRLFDNHCRLALFSLTNEKIAEHTIPRSQELPATLHEALQAIMTEHGIKPDELLGVGISFVDQFDHHYPDPDARAAFCQSLATSLGYPVVMESTAAACAAWHMLHGEAKGLQGFIYVHVGLQLEAAVVYGRRILLGHNRLTGAFGDVFVSPEVSSKDGELGRLNDFASLNALRNLAREPDMDLASINHLSEYNPKILLRWLEQAAEPMRIAIHMLESVLNSQTIIFGGDITPELLDQMIARLRPLIPSIAQYGERHVPRIIKTPNVQDIAMSGLATLPLHSALDTEQPYSAYLPATSVLTEKQILLYTARWA